MSGSDVEYIVWRGRFQPFTKIHFECIKGLYNTYIKGEDDPRFNTERPPYLVLCVIRDYETLEASHGVKLSAEKIESILSPPKHKYEQSFRHFSIFNPLSLSECIIAIRNGIQHFKKELDCDCEEFSQFLESKLFIVSSPITFLELIEVEKLFNEANSKNTEAIEKYEFKQENKEKPILESANPKEFIYALARETLSFKDIRELYWFLPMLDPEDKSDFIQLKDLYFERILLCFHPRIEDKKDISIATHITLDGLHISFYGAFAYYSYLVNRRWFLLEQLKELLDCPSEFEFINEHPDLSYNEIKKLNKTLNNAIKVKLFALLEEAYGFASLDKWKSDKQVEDLRIPKFERYKKLIAEFKDKKLDLAELLPEEWDGKLDEKSDIKHARCKVTEDAFIKVVEGQFNDKLFNCLYKEAENSIYKDRLITIKTRLSVKIEEIAINETNKLKIFLELIAVEAENKYIEAFLGEITCTTQTLTMYKSKLEKWDSTKISDQEKEMLKDPKRFIAEADRILKLVDSLDVANLVTESGCKKLKIDLTKDGMESDPETQKEEGNKTKPDKADVNAALHNSSKPEPEPEPENPKSSA